MDVAPTLAEGTVSVELTGAAETQTTPQRPEASKPSGRGESRADVKRRRENVDRLTDGEQARGVAARGRAQTRGTAVRRPNRGDGCLEERCFWTFEGK